MDSFVEFAQFVDQWAWVVWIALIAIFLVIEMLTLEFTFMMLSLGAAIGLVTDLMGVPVWLQIILASVAASLFLLFLRPPLIRRLRRGEDPTKSNVEALIELRGIALQEITQISGQVRLSNGDTWTARTDASGSIPAGSPIIVSAITGATAIVRHIND